MICVRSWTREVANLKMSVCTGMSCLSNVAQRVCHRIFANQYVLEREKIEKQIQTGAGTYLLFFDIIICFLYVPSVN